MTKYVSTAVPERTPPALKSWLARQFREIGRNLYSLTPNILTLDELNAEPVRPENGMIVRADGTNWNPGSGAGIYARLNSAWSKL